MKRLFCISRTDSTKNSLRSPFQRGSVLTVVAISFLGVSGCQTPTLGPLTSYPSQIAPCYVDSRTLSFESRVMGPTTNEDLNFMLDKYESWAHNHFIAHGPKGKAQLCLEALTVTHTETENNGSSNSLFEPAPNRCLAARIRLRLVVNSEDPHAHKERYFEANAMASHSYSKNITLLEREKILDSISNKLITALSKQFASIQF